MVERAHPAVYHMSMAELISTQSTCLRRQVGAAAVKDNRLIATGRNGNVPGVPHCVTCVREEKGIPSGKDVAHCFAVHAEINLLTYASLFGLSLKDSTIFVTNQPCFTCIKALASVHPLAVVYKNPYDDELTTDFLGKASWRQSEHEIAGMVLTVLRPPYSENVTLPMLYRGGQSFGG